MSLVAISLTRIGIQGASGHASDDDLIDERTPQEIRRAQAEKKAFEKAREQEADLAHAADLLGITGE